MGMLSYMFISLMRGIARVLITNGLRDDPWTFYIVSALLTGVFEEVGRYLVLNYAVMGNNSLTDCISYGIGHGVIEIILTNRTYENISIAESLLDGYECVRLILFSAAMSALIYVVIHYSDTKKFLAAAVIFHAVIDIIPAFYLQDQMTIGELMIIDQIYILAVCYFAYWVCRCYREE